jgi:hypothetical protein
MFWIERFSIHGQEGTSIYSFESNNKFGLRLTVRSQSAPHISVFFWQLNLCSLWEMTEAHPE